MDRAMKRLTGALCALALCTSLAAPAFAAEPVAEEETAVTEIGWAELPSRVRAGSISAQALTAQIDQLGAMDHKLWQESLRQQLNALSKASQLSGAFTSVSDTLLTTFQDLRDGEIQKDNEDAMRQIEGGLDQMVAGAQTFYLTIQSLEQSRGDLQRGIETIDRNLTALRLRRQLGQVSLQTVRSLEQTRLDTLSQLDTLESNIKTCKIQLQILLGEAATGELELGPLPALTDEQLDQLDPEKDLETAREKSLTIFSAGLTLDDARDTWYDSQRYAEGGYRYQMAQHAWEAAQLTYESTVQDFETSFQTLYRTIQTDRQTLETKGEDVAYARSVLANEQLRYDKGTIAKNTLEEARDDLRSALSAQESAKLQLFEDYHAYQNAVELGVLN